jgi:hypothetical protein
VQKKPAPTTLEGNNNNNTQRELTPDRDTHSYSVGQLLEMGVAEDPVMGQILEYAYECDPRGLSDQGDDITRCGEHGDDK